MTDVKKRMAQYDKLRPDLDTGDLVLFSGKGGVSAGIKWFTLSRWSHIGMVLNLPDWNMLLLWESTTLGTLADLESGKATRGVQLVPLSERLRTYEGEAGIRRLVAPRTPKMIADLQALRVEVRGRPYEKSKIALIKAAFDGPFGQNDEDLSSLFCSELVAEAYQRMGLINGQSVGGDPSAEYTPSDFSSKNDQLHLLGGATLTKEVIL